MIVGRRPPRHSRERDLATRFGKRRGSGHRCAQGVSKIANASVALRQGYGLAVSSNGRNPATGLATRSSGPRAASLTGLIGSLEPVAPSTSAQCADVRVPCFDEYSIGGQIRCTRLA